MLASVAIGQQSSVRVTITTGCMLQTTGSCRRITHGKTNWHLGEGHALSHQKIHVLYGEASCT